MQNTNTKNLNQPTILAVIPARGGSKGIPRKNLVDLCGKPLIAWSVRTGNELVNRGLVSQSVVSTDDAEIAAVAKEFGGHVPFLRPAELATDQSKTADVLLHALDWFKKDGKTFKAVLLLQPTSPQRDPISIGSAIKEFFRQKRAKSLITCFQEDYICDAVMYEKVGEKYLKPFCVSHNHGLRRQEASPLWIRSGAVYLTLSSYLRQNKKVICDCPMLFEIKKSGSIDLNNYDDLKILRAIMCKSEY